MPNWPAYTWNAGARQYVDARGRFVPRAAVRTALDGVIDASAAAMRQASLDLQAGTTNTVGWQIAMERNLKTIHVASGALAKGGWAQADSETWAVVGRRVRAQYEYLRNFAYQVANGLPLDGQFLARSEMYAISGTGTYEAILRRDDLAAGYTEERRVTAGAEVCPECLSYASMGWQPAGELPDIGEASRCLTRCRCRYERRRLDPTLSTAGLPQYGPSQARVQVGEDHEGRVLSTEEMERVVRDRLGLSLSLQDMASAVGATHDADVTVSPFADGDSILVLVRTHGVYKAERLISRDAETGNRVISNESFIVEVAHQGKGLGTEVFGRQVEQSARLGFDRIETYAARGKDMNGYYTWPRFGYDGPLPELVRLRIEKGLIPKPPIAADRVSDLMWTEGGRSWWKEHGQGTDLNFDLSPTSLSRRVWDGYRRERAARPVAP